ncbi:hypothetical protein LMG28138_01814 [Pararobbsia alpina]|uniref:Uncharacterized protein n=1 Tax=Pararobbsia alpina TaxID=621374 RepID=A0A6S7C9P3_9BURK|nr:hypothetical protein LMG28138_01814 [Pararobbsia alpina]
MNPSQTLEGRIQHRAEAYHDPELSACAYEAAIVTAERDSLRSPSWIFLWIAYGAVCGAIGVIVAQHAWSVL